MKKIIDIAAIILPALILFLGLMRLFTTNRKGHHFLTMLFAFLLLLAGIIRYLFFAGSSSGHSGPPPVPLSVGTHSGEFNQSLENILTRYYKMTDAFTRNDTASINQAGDGLRAALDSFKIDELKTDSLIYLTALQPYSNVKAEIASIIADPALDEKRGSLNIFSGELFTLLNTVHYDMAKLYWLECDKAFGEGKPGNWLSRTEKSENPYRQKDCAEVKSTIDFVPADSANKR